MKQNLCINRLFNTENKNNAKIPINKLINLYTNVTAICLHEYCGSDLFSKSCSRKKHAISNKKKSHQLKIVTNKLLHCAHSDTH